MNKPMDLISLKKVVLLNILDFFPIEELNVIKNVSKAFRQLYKIKHEKMYGIYKQIISDLKEYFDKTSFTAFKFGQLTENIKMKIKETECLEEDKLPIMFNLLYKVFKTKDYILIDFEIDEFTARFLSFLLKCVNIKHIKLMASFMNFKGIESFCEGIKISSSISYLSVNYSSNSIPLLLDAIEENKSLHKIDLSINNIPQECSGKVSHLLMTKRNITHWNLSSNFLGSIVFKTMKNVLLNNINVVYINLSGNRLGDEGAFMIGEILLTNNHLTKLCLNYNKITSEGLDHIVDALKTNKVLRELSLDGNHFGKHGGNSIADSIKFIKLTMITLRDCLLGVESVCKILESMINFEELTLTTVWLAPVKSIPIVKELSNKLKSKVDLDINTIKYN